MLTTVGVFFIELPREMAIVFVVLMLLVFLTRNYVLSMNLSLFSVPVSAWFLEGEWMYVGFWSILALMMLFNFRRAAREAMNRTGSKRDLLDELLHRKR